MHTIDHPEPGTGTGFGFAIALEGNRLVVGARFTGALGDGRVYVYDLAGASPTVPDLTLSHPDAVGAEVLLEALVEVFDFLL